MKNIISSNYFSGITSLLKPSLPLWVSKKAFEKFEENNLLQIVNKDSRFELPTSKALAMYIFFDIFVSEKCNSS